MIIIILLSSSELPPVELLLNVITLLQILSVLVFEKTAILCALQVETNKTILEGRSNQMSLLDF
jgi:hypothetical protein